MISKREQAVAIVLFWAAVLVVGYAPPWGFLAAVATYVLLAPAAVYANATRPLESAPYVVLPDGTETTPASDEWGRAVVDALSRHGFVPRARYFLPGPDALDFGRRLDNASTGEVAVITAGWQRRPGGPAWPIRVIAFHTRFRDGGELTTTNSPSAAITPDLPGDVSYRLPEITDPSALYSLHKRLVKGDGRKLKRIDLGDDPLAWELESNRRNVATQIALGLGERDEKAGVLRPTLKGALRRMLLLHPWLMRVRDRRATRAATAALRRAPA